MQRPTRTHASDFIYREISSRMHERLQLIKLNPSRVLDAGCGSGADLDALQANYRDAHVLGVDASFEKLRWPTSAASIKQSSTRFDFSWVTKRLSRLFLNKANRNARLISSDFSQLPFKDQTADLIWSNLALHWCAEAAKVFNEWRRVLKNDGLLMFSCFGPDTFKELRHAFEGIDSTPHTLSFVDMHDIGDQLLQTGFATPVMTMELITLTYATVDQLMEEVRSLGGNPLATRRRGLMGKNAWQTVCHKLEQQRRDDGRIPLTLEIIYGHAFKPAMRQSEPGVSVIHFDKLKK